MRQTDVPFLYPGAQGRAWARVFSDALPLSGELGSVLANPEVNSSFRIKSGHIFTGLCSGGEET